MATFFRRHWGNIFLTGIIAIYFFTFLYLSFAKHDYFFTGFRDLGIYDQIVYNTSRGDFFVSSLDIVRQAKNNALGLHTEFILLPFAAIYRFLPDPKVLLFFQTLLIALGAWPTYLIAKKVFRQGKWTLVFPMSYLLFPALEWVNLFEFHPLALVISPILFAFYFAICEKYIWYFIFIFLSLVVREDVGFMVASLGFYLLFFDQKKRIGFLTLFLGITWFFLMAKFISAYYLGENVSPLVSYYGDLGKTHASFSQNILTKIGPAFSLLLQKQNFVFLSQVFLPLGFTSFFGFPLIFASLPEFLILLLASKPEMHLINVHYPAFIIPFIFISSIYGVKFLVSKGWPFKTLAVIILFFSLFSNFWFSPSPLSQNFEKPPYMDKEKAEKLNEILKTVSHDVSLTTNQRLGSRLSQRREIYMFPEKINEVGYIVLYTGEFERHPGLITIYPEPQGEIITVVQKLRQDQNYETLYDEDELLISRKKQ